MDPLKPRFEISALSATQEFRDELGVWFDAVGKDFPWRRTNDPYEVLVSEMMLQQTRIATVLGKGYYTRFLEIFPDVESLSKADDGALLKAWEGLGYYRRARMLRDTATAVVRDHGGCFPDQEHELLKLPGIGPYTAAALMAFAFGKPSGLVDGNVSRVLSRLMDDSESIDSQATIRRHRHWSWEICDPKKSARHQHAMMELGQTVCVPNRPNCLQCPVAKFCKCTEPEALPIKKPRAAVTFVDEHGIWARDEAGRVLLHCEKGPRRRGLWKLPLRTRSECDGHEQIYRANYPITRYKVSLHIYLAKLGYVSLEEGDQWIDEEKLDTLPLAAPFRKAVSQLLVDF